MLNVYIGSTFQLAGSLQQDGAVADFTGWSLSASLYDANGDTLITPLSVGWTSITQGLLTVSATSTSNWPAGKAQIAVQLVSPAGEVILGPPTYIRILQSPLS
jgi:hypothetical protein